MPDPPFGEHVDGLMEMKNPEPNACPEAREGLPHPTGLLEQSPCHRDDRAIATIVPSRSCQPELQALTARLRHACGAR